MIFRMDLSRKISIGTVLPFLFVISCSSIEKKEENNPVKTIEQIEPPKVESVSKPEPLQEQVSEPEVAVEPVGPDLTGTWQLRRYKSLVTSEEFRFCKGGDVKLLEKGKETTFEKHAVSDDKSNDTLYLYSTAAGSERRGWLFRTVDAETFEIAKPKRCPPRKRCFAPSFERLVPLRYERISTSCKK